MKRSPTLYDPLCLLFLLNGLSWYLSLAQNVTEAGENTTNTMTVTGISLNPTGSSDGGGGKTSGGNCLIDTQMGLIAVASAGGLVICLLVSTFVLACQICYLQRRILHVPTSRSNVGLVSGTGYWDTDQPEVQGLMGPCDTSVMLEEMRADRESEENAVYDDVIGAKADAELEEGDAKASEFDQMQSSSSRDSCLKVPRDLEDMPLVV